MSLQERGSELGGGRIRDLGSGGCAAQPQGGAVGRATGPDTWHLNRQHALRGRFEEHHLDDGSVGCVVDVGVPVLRGLVHDGLVGQLQD